MVASTTSSSSGATGFVRCIWKPAVKAWIRSSGWEKAVSASAGKRRKGLAPCGDLPSADPAQGGIAVFARHRDVAYQDVRQFAVGDLRQPSEHLRAGGGRKYPGAGRGQHRSQRFARLFLVVHQQHWRPASEGSVPGTPVGSAPAAYA